MISLYLFSFKMSERIIKGQAWIESKEVNGVTTYSLVQEYITFSTTRTHETSAPHTIVEDIWADLKPETDSHIYKSNDKKDYFYWEVSVTDTETGTDITTKYTCPMPKDGLFTEPYDETTAVGDYAKYWVKKYKEAKERAENEMTIQRKEVIFPGTNCINQNGDTINYPNVTFKNNDIGDITNLLNLF